MNTTCPPEASVLSYGNSSSHDSDHKYVKRTGTFPRQALTLGHIDCRFRRAMPLPLPPPPSRYRRPPHDTKVPRRANHRAPFGLPCCLTSSSLARPPELPWTQMNEERRAVTVGAALRCRPSLKVAAASGRAASSMRPRRPRQMTAPVRPHRS